MTDRVIIKTPVGLLELVASATGLSTINFVTRGTPTQTTQPILTQAIAELNEYFAHKRQTFSVPLEVAGTDFQRSVWRQLQAIPWGKTISYGELAQRVGNSKASRAVGNANGKNPIPIIIPCHRVIAAGNKLGGYSGGLNYKRWLLSHEQVLVIG